jgi:hypothetical protein
MPPGGGCYPGVVGFKSYTIVNQTAGDTLSVWIIDQQTQIPTYQGDIGPGQQLKVQLPNCRYCQVVAVSQRLVTEWNTMFGDSKDPHDPSTAVTGNYWLWSAFVLGRDNGTDLTDYVTDNGPKPVRRPKARN